MTFEAAQIFNNSNRDTTQKILECTNQSDRMRLVISLLQDFADQNINNINNPKNIIIPSKNSDLTSKNSLNLLEEKISNSKKMSDEAKSIATKDIERLKSINKSSPEYDSLYNYVETLVNLPWDNSSPEVIDIKKAQVSEF